MEAKPRFSKAEILLICCIAFQLIICLMPFHYGDGYFKDAFYEMALGTRLAWGYVDVPPLAPFCIAVVRHLLGTSIFTVHLLPSLIGSFVIYLTYRMVKIFSGGFFAMLLSLIPMTFMAVKLGSFYNYSIFNFLFWNLLIYFLLKLFTTEKKKYWIYFGIIAGLGLMTKWTILVFGLGIVVSLLVTTENRHASYRKHFTCLQFWIGGFIAFLMLLPYLIWNYHHNFITFQFFKYYSTSKLIPMSVWFYIKTQIFSPFFAVTPVWLLGLYFLLFHKNGKKYRLLGVAYIIIFALCIIQHTKPIVIFPYYPVLIAAGAVFFGSLVEYRKFMWLKVIYVLFILAYSFYFLPTLRAVLPVQTFIKYYGHEGVVLNRQDKLGKLPMHYAFKFGWEGITQKVAEIYNSLSPEEKTKACIFTQDYGIASGIYFFSQKYGIPKPISPGLQFYIWGPGNNTGEITIWVDGTWLTKKNVEHWFRSVQIGGRTSNKYCLPKYNNAPIFLCKKPYKTFQERWKNMKMCY